MKRTMTAALALAFVAGTAMAQDHDHNGASNTGGQQQSQGNGQHTQGGSGQHTGGHGPAGGQPGGQPGGQGHGGATGGAPGGAHGPQGPQGVQTQAIPSQGAGQGGNHHGGPGGQGPGGQGAGGQGNGQGHRGQGGAPVGAAAQSFHNSGQNNNGGQNGYNGRGGANNGGQNGYNGRGGPNGQGGPNNQGWRGNNNHGVPGYTQGGHAPRARDRGRSWFQQGRFPESFRAQHRFRSPFNAPRGWYYQRWSYGQYLPLGWFGSSYYLDWGSYDLPSPPIGCEWVRQGSDAVLVDVWTGEVLSVYYDAFY